MFIHQYVVNCVYMLGVICIHWWCVWVWVCVCLCDVVCAWHARVCACTCTCVSVLVYLGVISGTSVDA